MAFKYDFSKFNNHELNLIAKELLEREYGYLLQIEVQLFGSKEIERINKVDLIQFVDNQIDNYDVVVEVKRFKELRLPNYNSIRDKLSFINEFLDCNHIILFLFDKHKVLINNLKRDLAHIDKLEIIDMNWIESVLDSEKEIVDKWNLGNGVSGEQPIAEHAEEDIESKGKKSEALARENEASKKHKLLKRSDDILKYLYTKYSKDNDFRFWLRQKDSTRSKEKRLSNGQWFQGSDYIYVGFSGITDQRNKTQSIGFVVVFDVLGKEEFYLEIVFPNETRSLFLDCYNEIYSALMENFGGISSQPDNKYRFNLFEEDWKSALDLFLNNYKPVIDSVISSHSLSKDFEIPVSKFKRTLVNVLKIREDLYPDDPIDPINSIQRSSYNHIPASKRKPVIGVDLLAKEVAKFLQNLSGDSAMIFGIFGRWGRGKTFLFNQVWKELEKDNHFIRVDFHAWLHQETPATWGYLYEVIAKRFYDCADNWWYRQWNTFILNCKRDPKGEIWVLVITLIVSLALYFKSGISNWLIGISSASSLLALTSLMLKWLKANSTQAKNIYKKYTQRHSFAQLLGTQSEVKKELKTLLKVWMKEKNQSFDERILLFVDDIDRCSEEKIVQVIDSIRIILEDSEIAKRLLVVIAVDERILKRAIKIKYERTLEEKGSLEMDILVREYLDKLFLAGIKLGNLNKNERAEIFNSLVEGKVSAINAQEKDNDKPSIDEETDKKTSTGLDSMDSESLRSLVQGQTPYIEQSINRVENNDSGENRIELSSDEWKELELQIRLMNDLTPRQIRIFYLRYLLGREFYMSLRSNPRWSKKELKVMIRILAYLYKQDLINNSIQDLIFNKWTDVNVNEWKELSSSERVNFVEILDIVVPY